MKIFSPRENARFFIIAPAAIVAITASLLCVAPLAAQSSGPSLSGSIKTDDGGIVYRAGIPDELANDWYSRVSARATISANSDAARFSASAWTEYDAVGNAWEISLDEAWGEWTPTQFFSARVGRARLQYGPCLAFSPANSFAPKDAFDSRASMVGLDGASAEFRPLLVAGAGDFPLALSVSAGLILPGGLLAPATGSSAANPAANSRAIDIDETSAIARVVVMLPAAGILGPTELGLVGDARRIGVRNGASSPQTEGIQPCAAGAWVSADVAGFVFGAEGSARSAGYAAASVTGEGNDPLVPAGDPGSAAEAAPTNASSDPEWETAFSLNRRLGDFFALAEADYRSATKKWLAFGRVGWSLDDASVSVSALVDCDTRAARSGLEATLNLSEFLVLGAQAWWNYLPEKWAPQIPAACVAGVSLEYFF